MTQEPTEFSFDCPGVESNLEVSLGDLLKMLAKDSEENSHAEFTSGRAKAS